MAYPTNNYNVNRYYNRSDNRSADPSMRHARPAWAKQEQDHVPAHYDNSLEGEEYSSHTSASGYYTKAYNRGERGRKRPVSDDAEKTAANYYKKLNTSADKNTLSAKQRFYALEREILSRFQEPGCDIITYTYWLSETLRAAREAIYTVHLSLDRVNDTRDWPKIATLTAFTSDIITRVFLELGPPYEESLLGGDKNEPGASDKPMANILPKLARSLVDKLEPCPSMTTEQAERTKNLLRYCPGGSKFNATYPVKPALDLQQKIGIDGQTISYWLSEEVRQNIPIWRSILTHSRGPYSDFGRNTGRAVFQTAFINIRLRDVRPQPKPIPTQQQLNTLVTGDTSDEIECIGERRMPPEQTPPTRSGAPPTPAATAGSSAPPPSPAATSVGSAPHIQTPPPTTAAAAGSSAPQTAMLPPMPAVYAPPTVPTTDSDVYGLPIGAAVVPVDGGVFAPPLAVYTPTPITDTNQPTPPDHMKVSMNQTMDRPNTPVLDENNYDIVPPTWQNELDKNFAKIEKVMRKCRQNAK